MQPISYLLNTLIITCSLRPQSESLKVGSYLKDKFSSQNHKFKILDLQATPLPFLFAPTPANGITKEQLLEEFKNIDSLIIISPEYNGSASPSYNNLMLYLGGTNNHLPTLLISLSASRSGTYPISHMKAFGNKNVKLNMIPEYLVIREVGSVFNIDTIKNNDNSHDYILSRTAYVLDMLSYYSEAYRKIISLFGVQDQYQNGM
jgi:NAD(P)H-dependent FMN reductase